MFRRTRPWRTTKDIAAYYAGPSISDYLLLGAALLNPIGRRFDLFGRLVTRIFPSTAGKPAYCPDRHVMIAKDLAAQPHARQPSCGKHITLSNRHATWLAIDKLDAARRAAGVSATRMQLVDSSILLECEHKPLAIGDLEFADIFNLKLWHCWLRREYIVIVVAVAADSEG
jgi:hypothetical protein